MGSIAEQEGLSAPDEQIDGLEWTMWQLCEQCTQLVMKVVDLLGGEESVCDVEDGGGKKSSATAFHNS